MSELDLLFQMPVLNIQILLDGLLVGAIFVLSAYGMALVWGVMNVINVSQGEYVMIGGYVAVVFAQQGVHPLFAVPAAAVFLFVLGWIIYRLVIFRVVDRDLFVSLLATFGLSILIQQLLNQIFTADVQTANSGFDTLFFLDGMVSVAEIKVVAFVLAFVIGGLLMLFLRHSRLGQAIRATAQNARAARILGIDTDRVYAATYGLNAALCGAAGALVAMTWVIQPFQGLAYTVRSFMIVVVAGLGNIGAVIVAGLGLGAAENFAGFLLGAEFQVAFVFSLLVIVLLWRSYRLGRKRRYLR
ncbi:MAG: branched-chain amino acid ABC transporter permease [Gammaproteobacteria bacterium]|jgi:branched-chain amino acid transport system permease protein